MDPTAFDTLARSVVTSGTRRRLLVRLTALLPLPGLGMRPGEEGAAQGRHHGRNRGHHHGKDKDNRKGKRQDPESGQACVEGSVCATYTYDDVGGVKIPMPVRCCNGACPSKPTCRPTGAYCPECIGNQSETFEVCCSQVATGVCPSAPDAGLYRCNCNAFFLCASDADCPSGGEGDGCGTIQLQCRCGQCVCGCPDGECCPGGRCKRGECVPVYATLADCNGQCDLPNFRPASVTICGQRVPCPNCANCQALRCPGGEIAGHNPAIDDDSQFCWAGQWSDHCTGVTCPRPGDFCNIGIGKCFTPCVGY